METVLQAVIDYEPRPQFERYHDRTERWACIVAHRRAGKTVACINDAILRAIECPHPEPRIAYLAPFYAQAKDIAWNYLRAYTIAIPEVQFNETELRVDLPNGGRIRLYGSDNYDRMRGIYLDGVILDEPAQMDPRAWTEVIRPALSDRQGWATFIGTPQGHNSFYEIWDNARSSPDWYALMLKASDTGLLPAAELADARGQMSADEYLQEYECSFDAAIKGAYYATEIARMTSEGRITHVPYDRYAPVLTGWDLGYTDSTAIWFAQPVGNELHLIDYYEADSKPLAHYTDILRTKQREWGEGFRWEDHYFPHDVQAHELTVGKSRVQTLRDLGIDPYVVPQHNINDGINAVRRIFDRFWIDGEKCARGIEALRLYAREYDEKTKMFRDRPQHAWPSHGADALRTFASGWPGNSARPKDAVVDRHRKRLYGSTAESWKTA